MSTSPLVPRSTLACSDITGLHSRVRGCVVLDIVLITCNVVVGTEIGVGILTVLIERHFYVSLVRATKDVGVENAMLARAPTLAASGSGKGQGKVALAYIVFTGMFDRVGDE